MKQLALSLALSLSAALSLTACVAGPVAGMQRDRAFDASSKWDKLGQRWVDGVADRDRIEVHRGERYSHIRLVVESSSIELHDLVITFENGQQYSPPTRFIFEGGSTSRDIELPGGLRNIARVEFKSGNTTGGRAMVEVWGLGAGTT
ncbi:MAG TPA: hypothetical protein VL326_05960 [Kofleriaceae bacterium]|jgi:hypothetical protein|nr:hypothetical protein [Kofleriaceae bacterium]